MSVMIFIPTDGAIHSLTAEATFAICANHVGGVIFRTFRAHPTDRCRNICARAFLESPNSHLLFIDSDVVPPPDTLRAMLATNRPLVTEIYPLQLQEDLCASVATKLGPNTYGFLHDFPDEPFEADAAGLGCCLIAREVFERVEYPWFCFVERPDLHQTGEDIFFFEKCIAAGIKPVVQPQVMCGHQRDADMLPLFEAFRRLRREVSTSRAA